MTRLRNPRTGSVVNVDDATGARYVSQGYEVLERPTVVATEKKATPRKRAATKKS